VLIDEQDIMLEAGVEMWLQTQVDDDWVVMAVDVGVDSVESLENLTDGLAEVFGESDTYTIISSCI
jgi:hypothetical protein